MTTPGFLQGAIICTIIHSMGKYGEAIIEVKHKGDDDYFEEFNLSNTPNDEKAFKRINDQIQHFLIHENEKGVHSPPKNDQGPRRYFYQKYMKIGSKHKTTTLPDNIKESFEQQSTLKNKILCKSSKIHQQNQETEVQAFHNLATGRTKDNSKGKIQMAQMPTLRTNKNYYNSMYHTNLANLQHKVSKQNEYNHNYNNRRLTGMNHHILNLNKKKTEKKLLDENRSSYYDKSLNKLEGRGKGIGNRNEKEMYKANKPSPIKNPFYLENVGKGVKKYEENIEQLSADHRRVRSCELRMEDMRESYMPNEQLSIYHPKMSMTDQFVLSDTMF